MEKELSRRAGTALGTHFPYSPPQTKYRNLPRKVSKNRTYALITKGLGGRKPNVENLPLFLAALAERP
jgi:hypothetical protein